MKPYNPLDKRNLGRSVADALLERELVRLPTTDSAKWTGAGVYAIYYFGEVRPYAPYARLAEYNQTEENPIPIYVGKAVPKGARKAGVGLGADPGTVLFDRLREHADSISATSNLDLADFRCRFLTVDDIWIPLGESLLIQTFRPVWNVLVGGFGNHDPGGGRRRQARSAWDTIHPGRRWASLQEASFNKSIEEIEAEVIDHLAGHEVATKTTLQAMEDEEVAQADSDA